MLKLGNLSYKQALAMLSVTGVLLMFIQYSLKSTSPFSIKPTNLLRHVPFIFQDKTSNFFENSPLDITQIENNISALSQNDSRLITFTRVRHLTPPSTLSYNLKGEGNYIDSFSSWVANFFKNKRGGTFIEAGANKGEEGSHTLYLEHELGWTGLLVECNPLVVPYLKTKHRKAWIADVCLSPTQYPATLNFSNPEKWSYSGTLGKPWNIPVATNWTFFDVQAIPLYTLIAAIGWTEIDYFSFDIEGQELNALKNFPFDKEELQELDQLMKSKGYLFVKKMEIDHIYVHENFKNMI